MSVLAAKKVIKLSSSWQSMLKEVFYIKAAPYSRAFLHSHLPLSPPPPPTSPSPEQVGCWNSFMLGNQPICGYFLCINIIMLCGGILLIIVELVDLGVYWWFALFSQRSWRSRSNTVIGDRCAHSRWSNWAISWSRPRGPVWFFIWSHKAISSLRWVIDHSSFFSNLFGWLSNSGE